MSVLAVTDIIWVVSKRNDQFLSLKNEELVHKIQTVFRIILLSPFVLLRSVVFRFFDLGESSTTRALVIWPPKITAGWRPIHRSLHITKKWFPTLARTITSPPMCPVIVHLIMETMVDLNKRTQTILLKYHNYFNSFIYFVEDLKGMQ